MKRALIVEDELEISEMLSEYLREECGFIQVDIATDGLEGFLLAMTHEYDIITLDHRMPYCLGTDLLQALRSKAGPNQHGVFFFISAFIPEISSQTKQNEQTFYLEKPLDFNRFSRYIKMSSKKAA